MLALQGLRAERYSDGRGRLMSAGDGWVLQPVMRPLRSFACLPYARITAHEKHAGIGMGWSAPMDSDLFVSAGEPVPGQNFLGPTANELGVLARRCLALDGGGHDCKSSPEVAAIRTRRPQCLHGCIQAFEVEAQLGSVHGPKYRQCGRTA